MNKHNYESVIVFTPVLSEEQLKDAIKKYRQLITEHGGEIVHELNKGMTKLAYPIQKKSSGFYVIFEFSAPTDLIKTIEIQFKRDERIMRFLTIALDKHAMVYNQRKRNGEFNKAKPATQAPATENKKTKVEEDII